MLGGLFKWTWIAAAIASIYFLYGVLAKDAPAYHVFLSIGAAFIAKNEQEEDRNIWRTDTTDFEDDSVIMNCQHHCVGSNTETVPTNQAFGTPK